MQVPREVSKKAFEHRSDVHVCVHQACTRVVFLSAKRHSLSAHPLLIFRKAAPYNDCRASLQSDSQGQRGCFNPFSDDSRSLDQIGERRQIIRSQTVLIMPRLGLFDIVSA
jgi:hypothetical protein